MTAEIENGRERLENANEDEERDETHDFDSYRFFRSTIFFFSVSIETLLRNSIVPL